MQYTCAVNEYLAVIIEIDESFITCRRPGGMVMNPGDLRCQLRTRAGKGCRHVQVYSDLFIFDKTSRPYVT